jgi:hypothetical protein
MRGLHHFRPLLALDPWESATSRDELPQRYIQRADVKFGSVVVQPGHTWIWRGWEHTHWTPISPGCKYMHPTRATVCPILHLVHTSMTSLEALGYLPICRNMIFDWKATCNCRAIKAKSLSFYLMSSALRSYSPRLFPAQV